MNNNLPYLNQERLDAIFEQVYELAIPPDEKDISDKLIQFNYVLKVMQQFNFRFRPDDYTVLYALTNPIFNFQHHSEGVDLWLSMMLAIKELYGFDNDMLIKLLKQVTVRK